MQTPACCRLAECCGLLFCGHTFSLRSISLLTEHPEVAARLSRLLRLCFDVPCTVTQRGATRPLTRLAVENPADRKKILIALGAYPGAPDWQSGILRRSCCKNAFLRGAFLACGSVGEPQKGYHAEFVAGSSAAADLLSSLLDRRHLPPRRTTRGRAQVLYYKDSDVIEDLLTLLGATNHTLALMHVKIYKDMRNKVNRIKNCETANISKTVDAALTQCRVLRRLRDEGRLEQLPPELREAAVLRLQNPEASLSELAALCDPPVSRSGFHHRIRRLLASADEET